MSYAYPSDIVIITSKFFWQGATKICGSLKWTTARKRLRTTAVKLAMLPKPKSSFILTSQWPLLPPRLCSGLRVRFVVGKLGVRFPSRIIPKDFSKWYLQLPCLALSTKGTLWRTRLACLLWPWARHLTGCLHLYEADSWRSRAVYQSWWPSLTED